MLRFVLDVLLLRRLVESSSVRRALLIIFALLFGVVLLYTANLFLTLNKRSQTPHVHAHSTH
jgi:hypothetical protein